MRSEKKRIKCLMHSSGAVAKSKKMLHIVRRVAKIVATCVATTIISFSSEAKPCNRRPHTQIWAAARRKMKPKRKKKPR